MLFPLDPFRFAWNTVSIDVVGPLPTSNTQLKYIIVAIYCLTKWVKARPIRDLSVLTTAKFILEQTIHQHGCTQCITSNNGTKFTLHVIPCLSELMGMHSALTALYCLKANGMVEWVNGTLVSILRELSSGQPGEWITFLPFAIFSYNIAHHLLIRRSLFMLLYGSQPALPPVFYS